VDKHEKLELIREKVQKDVDEIHKSAESMNMIADNFEKAANVAKNADTVISDIEKQFNELTDIVNKKDQIFLWTAVALQCVRWIFQPKINLMEEITPNYEDRIPAQEGAEYEKKENSEWNNKNSDKEAKKGKYLSWEEYFTNAVPYDAMNGTQDIVIKGISQDGVNICGKNHHAATLGNDPILGYILGTFNIMTSTITFNRADLLSRKVNYPNVTKESISIIKIVSQVIESEKEDKIRIPAAVARQVLHIQSDKFTKIGLPIPLLSAEKQQELLKKGWNSKELDVLVNELNKTTISNLKTVSIQLAISCIIIAIPQIFTPKSKRKTNPYNHWE